MNVAIHKLIDELEKLGMKRGYNDAELVKYGYGVSECKATFIIIYKKKDYCTVFSELDISRGGEYFMNESKNYKTLDFMENPIIRFAIISEMKASIIRYKELRVKFKKQQIEKDFA